jgi:hypothetical protein
MTVTRVHKIDSRKASDGGRDTSSTTGLLSGICPTRLAIYTGGVAQSNFLSTFVFRFLCLGAGDE